MKKLTILAGIAAFSVAAPALADPGRGNQGRGHDNHKGQRYDNRDRDYRSDYRNDYRRHGTNEYWRGSCPPGLAKKHNGCLPPGIAKKRYDRGQRWRGNYGYQWSYNQIPYDWRNQYGLDYRNRYYYNDGYLYSVDPSTMLVEQVIRAVIR
nr:hypothetical protein [uncultured Sphingomonas sp.]